MLIAAEIEFRGVKIKGLETSSGFVELEKLIEDGFKNLDDSAIKSAKAEMLYNSDHKFAAMLNRHTNSPRPIPEETKAEFRKEFIPYLWEYLKRKQDEGAEFLKWITE